MKKFLTIIGLFLATVTFAQTTDSTSCCKKEGRTIDLLGYSAEELKLYIQSLFTEGMTWENYGEWEIDHIKPVSKWEKTSLPSEVNALSNLQPLWKEDNIKKYNNYKESN